MKVPHSGLLMKYYLDTIFSVLFFPPESGEHNGFSLYFYRTFKIKIWSNIIKRKLRIGRCVLITVTRPLTFEAIFPKFSGKRYEMS